VVEQNPARLTGVLAGEGRRKGLGATGTRFRRSAEAVVAKGRPAGGAPWHSRAVRAWSSPPASPRPEQQGGGAARLQWSRKARVRGAGDCGIDRGQGVAAAGANADGELGRTGRSGVRRGQGPGLPLRRRAGPSSDQRTGGGSLGTRVRRTTEDGPLVLCMHVRRFGVRGVPGVQGLGRRVASLGRRGLPWEHAPAKVLQDKGEVILG
jgi:hypothetical protein